MVARIISRAWLFFVIGVMMSVVTGSSWRLKPPLDVGLQNYCSSVDHFCVMFPSIHSAMKPVVDAEVRQTTDHGEKVFRLYGSALRWGKELDREEAISDCLSRTPDDAVNCYNLPLRHRFEERYGLTVRRGLGLTSDRLAQYVDNVGICTQGTGRRVAVVDWPRSHSLYETCYVWGAYQVALYMSVQDSLYVLDASGSETVPLYAFQFLNSFRLTA